MPLFRGMAEAGLYCAQSFNSPVHFEGQPGRSSIARVERAHSYRARSASRRTTRLPFSSFLDRVLHEHGRELKESENLLLGRITSRNEFFQNFRIALGDLEKGFCRPGWFATALLPVLEGTDRNSKQRGKGGLRKPGHQPSMGDF